MPISKKQLEIRNNKAPTKSYILARIDLMHQWGIPRSFTDRYKTRLFACKTRLEVDNLAELMRHTFIERNFNQ